MHNMEYKQLNQNMTTYTEESDNDSTCLDNVEMECQKLCDDSSYIETVKEAIKFCGEHPHTLPFRVATIRYNYNCQKKFRTTFKPKKHYFNKHGEALLYVNNLLDLCKYATDVKIISQTYGDDKKVRYYVSFDMNPCVEEDFIKIANICRIAKY